MTEEIKAGPKWGRQQPVFLPKLLNKKVIVRTMDGTQITGTIKGFNNFEIRLGLMNGAEWLLFKHAILALEYPETFMDETK